MKEKLGIWLLFLVIIMGGCLPQRNLKKEGLFEETRFFMDTAVTIKAYGLDASEAVELAFQKMEELAFLMDRFNKDSELNLLNSRAGQGPQIVSADLYKVIENAYEYGLALEGTFDVSLAPLLDLWGFGQEKKTELVPSKEEIERVLSFTGLENIILEPIARTVELKSGTKLDLGGIAKGYIADAGMEILKEKGLTSTYINAGGDVVLGGGKPNGQAWAIGIRDPGKLEEKDYLKNYILNMSQGSIITSGSYERYFEVDGQKYHHILDPRTGYPAGELMSATVVGPSAMVGDILATAVMVLGVRGLDYLEDLKDYEGLVISQEGEIIMTSAFEKHFSQ